MMLELLRMLLSLLLLQSRVEATHRLVGGEFDLCRRLHDPRGGVPVRDPTREQGSQVWDVRWGDNDPRRLQDRPSGVLREEGGPRRSMPGVKLLGSSPGALSRSYGDGHRSLSKQKKGLDLRSQKR